MTKFQKVICVLLSICMLGGFIAYMPALFQISSVTKTVGQRKSILPLLVFAETMAGAKPEIEDEETYAAIVEANRVYLAEQVIGENNQDMETEQEEEQEPQEEASREEPEETALPEETPAEETQQVVDITREQLTDYDYLLNHFFIVDGNTATNNTQINPEVLLDKDMSLTQEGDGPKILIYHSHSQEGFADSQEGNTETTVVGVGNTLVKVLEDTYGYEVIHITDSFDIVNGEIDRNSAYDYARERVEHVLAENPSVEVVIDLHRDGVPEDRHLVTEVNGQPTAQIMFFNGLSYSAMNGPIEYLPNPYIGDNLAFSFQLQLASEEYYPGFNRPIYLSSLRYNLHLRPRAILLEVGAQNNTVEEAKNAMVPFAWILNKVLKGE